MKSANRFQKVKVTERDVLLPFSIIFTLNVALLLAWTFVNPLLWVRLPVDEGDSSGHWNTYGTCQSQEGSSTTFLVLIVLINAVALILACVQAYRARNISDEYSESKYVAMAVGGMLQILLVGFPIIIISMNNPIAKYFTLTLIIFVTCMAILLFMFLPKLIYLRDENKGLRGGAVRG